MAFFSELFNNVGELAKGSFSKAPISNQEVGLMQISLSGNKDEWTTREAVYPQWFFSHRLGQPRSIDTAKLRKLAKSAWVQMVLLTFKKQISTIPWQIVKEDEEDETDRSEDIKMATEFFNQINPEENINDLHSESITDLGEIDAGCWNYQYSMDSYEISDIPIYDAQGRIESYEKGIKLKPFGQRTLVKMRGVDGGTMLKQVDIHKNLLSYWQYSFKNPRQNPTRFSTEEIKYLMMNKKSYDVYGFSPVESVQQILELLIQGTRYNKDLYTNNAVPDYLVSLPKLSIAELKKLKRAWNNSYKGKPHQIGFINWIIDKIHKLADSNRDLEWLDGQKWFFKIVFGVFGVSPTEAGFFENSNKSNDDGQERVTVRNALKPYMALFERAHRQTLNEIFQRKDHGLCFKFFPVDQQAEKIEFEQDMKELEIGALTINEYRNKRGKDPVEWGNEPLRRPFNPENSFSNFGGNPMPPQNRGKGDDDDDDEGNKNYSANLKKNEKINPGEDVIEEAADYSDFLLKTFDMFEKKTLAAIDKIGLKKQLSKTFGEFMQDMFNGVNTKLFAGQVKKYLKADLVAGMVSAEKETGMDIGFTQAYQDKLNQLQGQQLDGYTINGKKWPGIKGVTKEIQAKVISTVQEGLRQEKTIAELKEDIKGVYAGFSDYRSEMITRTETNRILAEGKIIGYKETKMDGVKVWRAKLDNRTSDLCKRLNKQERELDDPFVDPVTNKHFMTTPGHPHCRCTLSFAVR